MSNLKQLALELSLIEGLITKVASIHTRNDFKDEQELRSTIQKICLFGKRQTLLECMPHEITLLGCSISLLFPNKNISVDAAIRISSRPWWPMRKQLYLLYHPNFQQTCIEIEEKLKVQVFEELGT